MFSAGIKTGLRLWEAGVSELDIRIDTKDVERLIRNLKSVERGSVIKRSLNLYGQALVSFSQVKRFRKGGFSSKETHPTKLTSRTGRLRTSIKATQTVKSGDDYVFKFGTNVEYAAIHEFGGSTRRGARSELFSRPRYTRGSRRGAFKRIGSSRNYSRGLTFSGSTSQIPARPYLRPALEDVATRQNFLNIFVSNINKALEAK